MITDRSFTSIDEDPSLYEGRHTEVIAANIEACADAGYPETAEPYARIMRGCADGKPMADDTAPFSKLGPVAWVMFSVIIAFPMGMVFGAGAKVCEPAAIVGSR